MVDIMTGTIQCRECKDVLSSDTGYGYHSCKCGETAIDVSRGGFMRYVGKFKELNIPLPHEKKNGT